MISLLEQKYIKYEKYIRYYFLYLLIIHSAFYFIFILYSNKIEDFSPYAPNIENINIGNGSYAKIGIVSDFQLSQELEKNIPSFKYYANNVYVTLNYFKKHDIDLIIIAGDITNNGRLLNLIYFKKIFYSVFNENSKPRVISLMGNHDYFDLNFTNSENQKKFYKVINSYPNSHYIINGYHFIFWSQDNYLINDRGITNYTWIKNNLDKARQNLKKKADPIFVITHIPPKLTVYGSETIWGHDGIYNFLKDYHEVICISGHSHYSLRNTRSIWQKDFTVVNTQSISYVDLDNYFINAINVRRESARDCESMGLIAHLTNKNIIFERVRFLTEEIMEEKWKINFPINIKEFEYTLEKLNKKEVPVFQNKTIKIEEKMENNFLNYYIVFNAAAHSEYVYKYKIVLKSFMNKGIKKVLYYYSDYYKNKKERKKIMKFKLPNINPGMYNIEIYAIDSFDNISQPLKSEISL